VVLVVDVVTIGSGKISTDIVNSQKAGGGIP
jgi:hypothetical protein